MGNIVFSEYTHRLLARVIVECTTPLAIGSGEKEIDTDAAVAQDANGMPYIPGTSIAGVVRSFMDNEEAETFFGNSDKEKGKGSEVRFSEGRILDSSSKVVDGLNNEATSDPLLRNYTALPWRQHVRISHKGTAADKGKFDEEIVIKGTRFCFEIEVLSRDNDVTVFNKILKVLKNEGFRLGSGSRNGFGAMTVIELKESILDLTNEEDLLLYIGKPSDLQSSADWQGWKTVEMENNTAEYVKYSLVLKPYGFFIFGSGLPSINGNESDPNISPVTERMIVWSQDGRGTLSERYILIPGSSVKGAIRHRTAYHFNKKIGLFAEDVNVNMTSSEDEPLHKLFGNVEGKSISKGKVLFQDVYLTPERGTGKNLSHIKIDRITGGVYGSALFFEEVTDASDCTYCCDILVEKGALEDKDIKYAFEAAISDVCTGLLPLGGAVNRGNGMFIGEFTKTE